MLRKRSRSNQKDQHMGHLMSDVVSESNCHSDALGQKHKSNSFLNVPGVFVGFSPKGASESDSVRSPTSPLDFRIFSNLAKPFRSSKSSHEGQQKSWDCNKVGLSIVDCLDDDTKQSGKVLRSSDSKNILFGPQMRIKTPNLRGLFDSFEAPKSLPINYAISPGTPKPSYPKMGNSGILFGIGETPLETMTFEKIMSCSMGSGSHFFNLTNPKNNAGSGNFCVENGTDLVGSNYQLIRGSPNLENCSGTKLTSMDVSIGSGNGVVGSVSASEITNPVGSSFQLIRGSPNLSNSSGTKLTSMEVSIGSGNGFVGSFSASEIERSEDYTCVRTHGPNPKTTHIFGDCILECHNEFTNLSKSEEQETALPLTVESSEVPSLFLSDDYPKTTHIFGDCILECHSEFTNLSKSEEQETALPLSVESSEVPCSYPSDDFLSFCYSCKKKLEGEDIYMYRGEKAFCSWNCRAEEILIEEAMEKTSDDSSTNSLKPKSCEELFETNMFIAT